MTATTKSIINLITQNTHDWSDLWSRTAVSLDGVPVSQPVSAISKPAPPCDLTAPAIAPLHDPPLMRAQSTKRATCTGACDGADALIWWSDLGV